jgi:RNA recognition motif-containing protein
MLHSLMSLNNWISVVSRLPTLVGGLFISGLAGESSKKMEIRIYVGNLGKSTSEAEINTLFAKAGEVTSVELVKDRDSGQSKGFAFVNMTNQADADKAIGMYNAFSLNNNELKVNIAKPRIEKPSRN